MKKKVLLQNALILLIITALTLFTVLMQGIPFLAALPQGVKTAFFLVLLLPAPVLCLCLKRKGALTQDHIALLIIYLGMLLHCFYVTFSGLYERQHDEGVYTGAASPQVNPGHIGYIEYIYKFRRLPDFHPYRLFSYYHPPFHYVISGVFLILLTALGMPEDLAFENLQALPLFYSGLFLLLAFLILKKLGAEGGGLYAGLLLVSLHPALTFLSGSVNNDMLSCVLLSCSILATLCYLKEKSLKNLLLIALSIGFGMLCKLNTALIALPVGLVFLLDFIGVLRSRDARAVLSSLRRYILFGITAAVTGLSFIVRNLLLFHVKPGIASATETSVMYTGGFGLWERLGVPALSDWHFSFPFHSLNGGYNRNTWVIMFQTSLFAEEFPTDLSGVLLFLCQAAYALAIVTGAVSAVVFIVIMLERYRRTDEKKEAVFLLAGYLTFLLGFAAFTVKYPYTCSSDFRYIAVCLIYIAAALAGPPSFGVSPRSGKYAVRGRVLLFRFLRAGVCLTALLTTVICLAWRW